MNNLLWVVLVLPDPGVFMFFRLLLSFLCCACVVPSAGVSFHSLLSGHNLLFCPLFYPLLFPHRRQSKTAVPAVVYLLLSTLLLSTCWSPRKHTENNLWCVCFQLALYSVSVLMLMILSRLWYLNKQQRINIFISFVFVRLFSLVSCWHVHSHVRYIDVLK
jgi:hypothetical protein